MWPLSLPLISKSRLEKSSQAIKNVHERAKTARDEIFERKKNVLDEITARELKPIDLKKGDLCRLRVPQPPYALKNFIGRGVRMSMRLWNFCSTQKRHSYKNVKPLKEYAAHVYAVRLDWSRKYAVRKI